MKRKLLSTLLVLAMILSIVPAMTIFASATPVTPVAWVDKDGDETQDPEELFDTVQDAIDYASPVIPYTWDDTWWGTAVPSEITDDIKAEAKKVVLVDDVTLSDTIQIKSNTPESSAECETKKGYYTIIDLNDHILRLDANDKQCVIYNDSYLTIEDNSQTKTDRYFVDNKCAHDIAIGEACEDCGTEDGKAKADGHYETAVAEKPSEGTDYITVSGGMITGTGLKVAGIYTHKGTFYFKSGNIAGVESTSMGGVNSQSSTMEMTGGKIINCVGEWGAGGILSSNGTLKLSDCSIEHNVAYGNGGGISFDGYYGYLTCELTNVTIKNNYALREGGGVYFEYGSAECTVSGGEICDNYAGNGGGMCIGMANTKLIGNVNIHNNKSEECGGVYCETPLAVGDTVKVENNTLADGATPSNMAITSNSLLSLESGDHAPKSGMRIGVTFYKYDYDLWDYFISDGQFTTECPAEYKDYFFSDSEDYSVITVAKDVSAEDDNLKVDHLELKLNGTCKIRGTDGKTKKFYQSLESAMAEILENESVTLLLDSKGDFAISKSFMLNKNGKAYNGEISAAEGYSITKTAISDDKDTITYTVAELSDTPDTPDNPDTPDEPDHDSGGKLAEIVKAIFGFKSIEMFSLGEFLARLVERILDIFR